MTYMTSGFPTSKGVERCATFGPCASCALGRWQPSRRAQWSMATLGVVGHGGSYPRFLTNSKRKAEQKWLAIKSNSRKNLLPYFSRLFNLRIFKSWQGVDAFWLNQLQIETRIRNRALHHGLQWLYILHFWLLGVTNANVNKPQSAHWCKGEEPSST